MGPEMRAEMMMAPMRRKTSYEKVFFVEKLLT